MYFGKNTKSGMSVSARKSEFSPEAKSRARKARQTRQDRSNRVQTQSAFGKTRAGVAFPEALGDADQQQSVQLRQTQVQDDELGRNQARTITTKITKTLQLSSQGDGGPVSLYNKTTKHVDYGKPGDKRGGSGQLSAYFQNKLTKVDQRKSSAKKFGNMTQTLKDLKSMIHDDSMNEGTDPQVGIIQNSVRHSGVMKSVNALKSSFLENAAVAKKAQDQSRVSRGRARNAEELTQTKYASTVLNTSIKREQNASKNYSINSRINNPRPLNNLAKNHHVLDSNTIKETVKQTENIDEHEGDGSSFEHISMGSFEDRPSTVKNSKGLKKIQFDEIMKGIVQEEEQVPLKRSATIAFRETNVVDTKPDQPGLVPKTAQFQGSTTRKHLTNKTFFAPTRVPLSSKKVPMTTKHQAMVTTISFNTAAKEENKVPMLAHRSAVVPETKQKSMMKKKLMQQTRTGIQSPRITTQTAGEKGKDLGAGKSPAPLRKPALNTGLSKPQRSQAIKTSYQINSLSTTIIKEVQTTKNKSSFATVDLKGQLTNKNETRKGLNKYGNETITLNFSQKETLKQVVKPSQRSQSNSFLMQSKSLNTLLPASKDFLVKPLAIQTIYEENEAVKQEPSEIYNDKPEQASSRKGKPWVNFEPLKFNKLKSFRDDNPSTTLEKRQQQRQAKAGLDGVGNQTQILPKEPIMQSHTQRLSTRPFSKKKSNSNMAKEHTRQAATTNKVVRAPASAKVPTKEQTVRGTKVTSQVFDRKVQAAAATGRNAKKLTEDSYTPKVNQSTSYNTHQGGLKQQLKQNMANKQMQRHISNISISFKAKDGASKNPSPNKKMYKTIDQSQLHVEAAEHAESRGASPLQDIQIVGQYKTNADTTERVLAQSLNKSPIEETPEAFLESDHIEVQEAHLERKRSSKKSENTVTFDFHPEKAEQPATARGIEEQANNENRKSHKTLSFEKSEVTRSSPNSKKIEHTVKKATQLVQNAKTSISNPVNRLSSLSGQKNMLQTPCEQKASTPDYPMSASDAKKYFKLTDFELQEIERYDKQVYYVGNKCNTKVKGHPIKYVNTVQTLPRHSFLDSSRLKDRKSSRVEAQESQQIPSQRQKERLEAMNIYNYGYDDEGGDYKTQTNDHLGYRYQVVQSLGSGSFGQALQCLDHRTNEMVAVKIIKNQKKFQYQAGMELKILKYLNYNDKNDQNNIIRVLGYQIFREHLLIAFELLSINLYEFIKKNDFRGVSQNLIRRFAIQILQALHFQQSLNLVHCDLKPENILLKQENKSGIKLIDYGSSCFLGQRIYTYIQSRFYRAPEIILGIPYTTAIDIWSFGCIIAELFTGYPLFPGEDEVEQLAYIMEIYGAPPKEVIKLSSRGHLFFHKNGEPILSPNSRGKIRNPSSKSLSYVLRCDDDKFLDFIDKCLAWNPTQRITPIEALQHPWILEGLPEKVLKHHTKMFNNNQSSEIIKKATSTPIQGFPQDKKNITIHQMVAEQTKDDQKRHQMLHRKQNSELEFLKSEKLIGKAESLSAKKSPEKTPGERSQQPSSAYDDNCDSSNPSKQAQRERKSRKQRLTRISEQNADNSLNAQLMKSLSVDIQETNMNTEHDDYLDIEDSFRI